MMKYLIALLFVSVLYPASAQRLSLDPNNPVMAQDTTSTAIYWNGVSASLSGLTANAKYDVYSNAGALCIGPAWTANTPPVSDQYPGPTNASGFTCQGGAVCSAGQCGYIGSIMIDPTAGQISCLFSYGQNRRCGVWNLFNQVRFGMRAGNPSSPVIWVPAYEPTLGCYLNDCNNSLTVFAGRNSYASAKFQIQNWIQAQAGYSAQQFLSIGWDSSGVGSGFSGGRDIEGFTASGGFALGATTYGEFNTPFIGAHVVYSLYRTQAVVANCSPTAGSCIYWANQEVNQLLTAEYMN